jgi:hypothetical protein
MVRMLVTRVAWLLDDELEEEREEVDDELEELEEELDSKELDSDKEEEEVDTARACCCLSAFWTDAVMLGVRAEMICWTREVTWAWDTSWLALWLEKLEPEELELEELELEELEEVMAVATADWTWVLRAAKTCLTSFCCFCFLTAAPWAAAAA